MDRWKRLLERRRSTAGPSRPWYRRPDIWVAAGAIVLPFGWVLPLARLAWVHVATRRAEAPEGALARDSRGDPTAETP